MVFQPQGVARQHEKMGGTPGNVAATTHDELATKKSRVKLLMFQSLAVTMMLLLVVMLDHSTCIPPSCHMHFLHPLVSHSVL